MLVAVRLWGKYLNRELAYNSNDPGSYNSFTINQKAHIMRILIYMNMKEQGKQNPKERKVSAITVYFRKSDQASIPGEYKIYIIFILIYTLHKCLERNLN